MIFLKEKDYQRLLERIDILEGNVNSMRGRPDYKERIENLERKVFGYTMQWPGLLDTHSAFACYYKMEALEKYLGVEYQLKTATREYVKVKIAPLPAK